MRNKRLNIVAIGGGPLATWGQFTARVRASASRTLSLEVERAGQRLAISAVPEPTGLSLLALGAIGLIRRRRRQGDAQ